MREKGEGGGKSEGGGGVGGENEGGAWEANKRGMREGHESGSLNERGTCAPVTFTLDASPTRTSVATAASNLAAKPSDKANELGQPLTTACAAITCTGTGTSTGAVGGGVPIETTGLNVFTSGAATGGCTGAGAGGAGAGGAPKIAALGPLGARKEMASATSLVTSILDRSADDVLLSILLLVTNTTDTNVATTTNAIARTTPQLLGAGAATAGATTAGTKDSSSWDAAIAPYDATSWLLLICLSFFLIFCSSPLPSAFNQRDARRGKTTTARPEEGRTKKLLAAETFLSRLACGWCGIPPSFSVGESVEVVGDTFMVLHKRSQ